MTHYETSAFDSNFLSIVEVWFAASNNIFVVARFSRTGGGREYLWLKQYSTFRTQIDAFPPETDVIVFRDNQFPLRGIVNDDLIHQALEMIPDHTEAMVVDTLQPPDKGVYIWYCDTHAELTETLHDLIGKPASIGFYAPWHEADSETMISALIPYPDGTLKRGAY